MRYCTIDEGLFAAESVLCKLEKVRLGQSFLANVGLLLQHNLVLNDAGNVRAKLVPALFHDRLQLLNVM